MEGPPWEGHRAPVGVAAGRPQPAPVPPRALPPAWHRWAWAWAWAWAWCRHRIQIRPLPRWWEHGVPLVPSQTATRTPSSVGTLAAAAEVSSTAYPRHTLCTAQAFRTSRSACQRRKSEMGPACPGRWAARNPTGHKPGPHWPTRAGEFQVTAPPSRPSWALVSGLTWV